MKEKEKKMEKKKKEMAFAVSCRDPGIYRSAGITDGSRKCKSQTGNNEDPAEPDIGRDQLFFLRIIQRKELDVQ